MTFDSLRFTYFLGSVALSLANQQAQAQEFNGEHHWALGIGIGTYSVPDYPGSSHIKQFTAPIPYVHYQGPHIKLADGKISSLIFKSNKLLIDMSIDGTPPVKSKNNSARNGMPDLDPVLELGPEFSYYFWKNNKSKLYLSLPIHYGFALNKNGIQTISWSSNPRLKFNFKRGFWKLKLGVGPVYASRQHHDFYYSIALNETNTQRHTYQSDGKFGGLRYSLGLQMKRSHFKYDAYIRYNELKNADFSNSPLLKNKHDVLGAMAITWVFRQQ